MPLDPMTVPLSETNPFRDLLGIAVERGPEPGVSRVVIRSITDKLRQKQGVVHGGVYATMIDAALGEAVHLSIGPGGSLVTVELNLNLMRAVADGGLAAIGRVIHAGGTLVIATADVFDDENRLAASGRGTFRVRRPAKEES